MMSELDMQTQAEFIRTQVRGAASQFAAYAVTTGDAAITETVGTVTTSGVTVWLDGVPQTPENKTTVTLVYGQAAPAAGQLWLVLLPNFDRSIGVMFLRLA